MIEVGRAECTAHDLLGPEGWDDYVRAVREELGRLAVHPERIGLELALQMVAVGGSVYAPNWHPNAQGARAIQRAREYTMSDPSKLW